FSLTNRTPVSERELFAFFPGAELILLEGFKGSPYKKLELVRKGVSTSPVCDPGTCIALVSDLALETDMPLFHPDAAKEIAAFIAEYTRKGKQDD
ncbi:MAG: molybdopterin-guanine dinucleotide biosynthesis protein MobB, partial [Oscillospiraceae bacterium]|nr:molybdopterin-guanine dinucleotide biosynthesis protein MobB [Oscillospiraceae bacterium]